MTKTTDETREIPFVSVIITFYNVEKYARYCMRSLVGQDYDNCEFVCVDDGSKDNTLAVLKEYASDKRVKIFHKENGGLSDARNYGLSVARGRFITLIDGDDYIHPRYISEMIAALEGQDDAIVISPLKVVKYSESIDERADWAESITHHSMSKGEVYEKILYNELSVSACAKLVPKEAYEEVSFPVGKVSEEVATIGALLRKYDKFVMIEQPMYRYVMRAGSIGHKREVPFREIMDRIEAFEVFDRIVRHEFNIQSAPAIQKALLFRRGLRYVDMADYYDIVSDDKHAAKELEAEIKTWLRENIRSIIHNKRAPLKQRLRIWLYAYMPRVYELVYSIYRRIRYSI